MPRELEALERTAVRARRKAAGLQPDGDPPVGLALSGGGIRSATFCLGVLQALAGADLLRRFDYLSTVSGGSYIGAFLGRLFSRPGEALRKALVPPPRSDEVASSTAPGLVGRILTEPSSKPLAFLRENGRYLSPNGSGDLLLGASVVVRNLVAVHVVLWTCLLTAFLLAQCIRILVLSLTVRIGGPEAAFGIAGWFLPAGLVGILFVFPLGWAYWLGQPMSRREPRSLAPATGGACVLLVSVVLLGLDLASLIVLPLVWRWFLLALAAASVVALVSWRLAVPPKRPAGPGGDCEAAPPLDSNPDRVRNNRLSRWLTAAIVVCLASLVFGIVDLAGLKLYRAVAAVGWNPIALLDSWPRMTSAAGVGGLIVFGRKLATFLAGRAKASRLSMPAEAIASLAALALVAVVLVAASFLSWALVSDPSGRTSSLSVPLLAMLGAGLVASLLFGSTLPFLNQSSLQMLYGARLSRAYLGASNPARWTDNGMNVTEPIDGDGIPMESYRPDQNGGPLHIVNVTLNETIGGKSHVEQRDRKGLGMAIGPIATSVGRRAHALHVREPGKQPSLKPLDPPKGEFAVFSLPSGCDSVVAEPLSLETWVAISGAAVSTGLGARTSLGLSVLCGLFNVRLGYWWNSGVDPAARSGVLPPSAPGRARRSLEWLLPVQMHLVDELLARFRGPNARRWYLTDGGHFENTGVYELIRRRLPLIVACDDGADPGYQYADIANLVRKARLDFSTEIAFLGPKELSDGGLDAAFGTLDDVRRDAPGTFSRRRAALARVSYPDGREGRLVVLKPSLDGSEPRDLIQYQVAHPAFPQEPTGDQFFDEAQWESYRKLGEVIGRDVAPALERLLDAHAAPSPR